MSCKGLCLIFLFVCFIPAGCSFLERQPDPSRFFALTSLPRTAPESAGCRWNQRACPGNRADKVSGIS